MIDTIVNNFRRTGSLPTTGVKASPWHRWLIQGLQAGVATAILLTGVPSLASEGGTTAEQIQSRSLCQQAVGQALRRGDPDARSVYCGFASYDSPDYWRCVNERVTRGTGLAQARREC